MSGRVVVLVLVALAAVAGAAMYWLQVFAFYTRLAPEDVALSVTHGGAPMALPVTDLRAIDATSSPIRFRACFQISSEVIGDPYPEAVPLNAPFWFDCFDADEIGEALSLDLAVAYLGEANVQYGIDRVIAIFPDGRGVAWHQINRCGEEVFDGNPPPEGCPPPPERLN